MEPSSWLSVRTSRELIRINAVCAMDVNHENAVSGAHHARSFHAGDRRRLLRARPGLRPGLRMAVRAAPCFSITGSPVSWPRSSLSTWPTCCCAPSAS